MSETLLAALQENLNQAKGQESYQYIDCYAAYLKGIKAAREGRRIGLTPSESAMALTVMKDLMTVYFLHCPLTKRVKIGRTAHLKKRIASIQGSSPTPLTLLHELKYDSDLERRIHNYLEAHRLHGEWFHMTEEVSGFIEGIKEKGLRWMVHKVGDRGDLRTPPAPPPKEGEIVDLA